MNEKENASSPTIPDWDTFCRIAFKARFEQDREEFIKRLQELEAAPQPSKEAA